MLTNSLKYALLSLNENVLCPLLNVDGYNLNSLKSNYSFQIIKIKKDNYLKSFSSDFRKGWLYDEVIKCFYQ